MMLLENTLSKDIFKYLEEKLELPENIIRFSLHMGVDEVMTVDCTFCPEAKKYGD